MNSGAFGNAKGAVLTCYLIGGLAVKENRPFCSVLFAMLKYTNLVIIARGGGVGKIIILSH